jgi:hypothetical protein
MSNLTWALTGLAVLVLVSLGAHGVWTARLAARRQQAPMQVRHAPVEPGFAEPASAAAPPDAQASGDGHRAKRQAARIDALIDAVATLAIEAPVSGEQVLAHLPGSLRAGSKPFLIEGLNATNGQWEPMAATLHYSELQAGVQLANRSGAINEIEYSEFVHTLQRFADALGAMVEFPDMLDVVARARVQVHSP